MPRSESTFEKTGLALEQRKRVEPCQSKADLGQESVLCACKEKRLLMDGKQNIVSAFVEQFDNASQIGRRVDS
jgi:hypothetical protein